MCCDLRPGEGDTDGIDGTGVWITIAVFRMCAVIYSLCHLFFQKDQHAGAVVRKKVLALELGLGYQLGDDHAASEKKSVGVAPQPGHIFRCRDHQAERVFQHGQCYQTGLFFGEKFVITNYVQSTYLRKMIRYICHMFLNRYQTAF